MKGWGGGAVMKCMCCSCKRPKFRSQPLCQLTHNYL